MKRLGFLAVLLLAAGLCLVGKADAEPAKGLSYFEIAKCTSDDVFVCQAQLAAILFSVYQSEKPGSGVMTEVSMIASDKFISLDKSAELFPNDSEAAQFVRRLILKDRLFSLYLLRSAMISGTSNLFEAATKQSALDAEITMLKTINFLSSNMSDANDISECLKTSILDNPILFGDYIDVIRDRQLLDIARSIEACVRLGSDGVLGGAPIVSQNIASGLMLVSPSEREEFKNRHEQTIQAVYVNLAAAFDPILALALLQIQEKGYPKLNTELLDSQFTLCAPAKYSYSLYKGGDCSRFKSKAYIARLVRIGRAVTIATSDPETAFDMKKWCTDVEDDLDLSCLQLVCFKVAGSGEVDSFEFFFNGTIKQNPSFDLCRAMHYASGDEVARDEDRALLFLENALKEGHPLADRIRTKIVNNKGTVDFGDAIAALGVAIEMFKLLKGK